jgi:hypothetical protein
MRTMNFANTVPFPWSINFLVNRRCRVLTNPTFWIEMSLRTDSEANRLLLQVFSWCRQSEIIFVMFRRFSPNPLITATSSVPPYLNPEQEHRGHGPTRRAPLECQSSGPQLHKIVGGENGDWYADGKAQGWIARSESKGIPDPAVLQDSSKEICIFGNEANTLCNSLPTRTMSYWSMCPMSKCSWGRELLTVIALQRVLVERPAISWKLFVRPVDWEGIFWEGLSCYA